MSDYSVTDEIKPSGYLGNLNSTERKEGDRLVLEPIRTGKLLSVLRALGPMKVQFPDIDDELPPLDEPDL